MDVATLLQNSLDNDQKIRANAVEQLQNAEKENFGLYMLTLSRELENEDAQAVVRIASGLALKNALFGREIHRREEMANRWNALDGETRAVVRHIALKTLNTSIHQVGLASSQLVAAIAAIELPLNQWTDLMSVLVEQVSDPKSTSQLKEHCLKTIGYICESTESHSLQHQSNSILTAVVQGARKEELDPKVRFAALNALYDSLEFVKENFAREGERNYIMQVCCEATQSEVGEVQLAGYGCLIKIMSLYYEHMPFYMEKALFGLTVTGMQSDNEQVALQAVEFWCQLCEEEIDINYYIQDAVELGQQPQRQNLGFGKVAMPEIIPTLLKLLCKQDENADEDEWNISMAAGTCIELFAQNVQGDILGPVLSFIEENITSPEWRKRDAAAMAFGSILEGPDPVTLQPLVQQALPVLIGMMTDSSVNVQDTVAWTLGRASRLTPSPISPETHLPILIQALLKGLESNPKIIANCAWTLMNITLQFSGETTDDTSYMSPYSEAIIFRLLAITDQPHNEYNSRTSAYEAFSVLVANCANDIVQMIDGVIEIIIRRLEASISLQTHLLSVEERTAHEELQTNICSLLTSVIRRLGGEILKNSDQIMVDLVRILETAPQGSVVPEDSFTAVSALVIALESNFSRYLEPFMPYLHKALENSREVQLCTIAVGLVGDLARSMGDRIEPFADQFCSILFQLLQSGDIDQNIKPVVFSCLGDIALGLGHKFQKYLHSVLTICQQASAIRPGADSTFDQCDYIQLLRESVLEAYSGIVQVTRESSTELMPFVKSIMEFLAEMAEDIERSESTTRSIAGLIGDLAETFQNSVVRSLFAAEWIDKLLKEAWTKSTYSKTTKETAKWASELVSRCRA